MMRIVIAGGGYFARLLAEYVSQTPHPLIIISRVDRSAEFQELDCQVLVVDYDNPDSLLYALRGVDLVISTISGNAQLNLIDAARRIQVARFVPSEFEGALRNRPVGADPLDIRGSTSALELLQHWSASGATAMRYTVFSCGLFYERFGPDGLAAYEMGGSMGVSKPSDYLVDVAFGVADVVEESRDKQPINLCMTSMLDVARLVAAAIEITGADATRDWPREFRMRGDQVSVRNLLQICRELRGTLNLMVRTREYEELSSDLTQYQLEGDLEKWSYTQRLLATANGRYSFQTDLNELVEANGIIVEPVDFQTWMRIQWS